MCQGGGVEQPPGEASRGQASTIGLDIAKWVFQAHGADATGRVVFRKRLVRAKVLEFFAGQPPCLVALEACGGAHYWARELGKLGHTVRLIPPAYVKPFVKRQKNDVAESPAASEAATVAREGFFSGTDKALDGEITRRAKADPTAHRLMTIPGIGPIAATAIIALVPAPEGFRAGRDFAAWLGLTPLQKSTGGKHKLGAISKMGERTIRRLLILGASAVVRWASQRGAAAGS